MDNKTKPTLNMRYYNREITTERLMMICLMLGILITTKKPALSTMKKEMS